MKQRKLETQHGSISFPTFMPVTTFGGKYPLDDLIRPYLKRLSQCVMVSYYYAKQMKGRPNLPLFIDSGGFASLFEGSKVADIGSYACIKTKEGELITPLDVLALQEKHADIGATLDFIISPKHTLKEKKYRQEMTLKNAIWAIENKKNQNLKLFASVQAWDKESAVGIMEKLVEYPFDGFALGGMVSRVKDPKTVISIVKAIREIDNKRPLHVFGIGQPVLIGELFKQGVDSTDSSSFLRATADKRILQPSTKEWISIKKIDNQSYFCECPICHIHGPDYFKLVGETNNLTLALHNLKTITS